MRLTGRYDGEDAPEVSGRNVAMYAKHIAVRALELPCEVGRVLSLAGPCLDLNRNKSGPRPPGITPRAVLPCGPALRGATRLHDAALGVSRTVWTPHLVKPP